MAHFKSYLAASIAVLIAGALFAWTQVVTGFIGFYEYSGTLFKIKDCAIPNPVATPCFYGAIGFLAALGWAITLVRKPAVERKQILHRPSS
jgi:hypothetical protein